ncbi:MAG: cell division protein FtsL [Oceanococcaceae bacterium]
MFTLLYVAIALSALAVVRMRHDLRQAQAALQEEQQRAQDLAAEARQLELERATLAAPARIESMARRQLGMHQPTEVRVLPPVPTP